MKRTRLAAPAALALLGCATAAVAASVTSVTVNGKLTSGGAAGSSVTATANLGPTGFTGSGKLFGVNPQTHTSYSYPFRVANLTTGRGTVIMTGKLDAGFPFTLTAQVPSGTLSFVYTLPNGSFVNSSGQGTVTTH